LGDIIKLEESISEKFIESPLKVGSEVSDSPDNSSAGDDSSVIIFALWLLVFSASSQLMIVVAMLPEIGKQLSVSDAKQGLLVSIYAVMVGIFALVIGPISDKIGRRKVLLAGTGLMTAALAMHAAVFDYTGLLIVRTLAERLGDERHSRGTNRGRSAGVTACRILRVPHAVLDFCIDDGRNFFSDIKARAAAQS
jgi:hypothetical protein